jgi:acylphosphatase
MTEKICVRAIISGRVQGVFFRMETRKAAQRIGVFGWVKNKKDGTVEALFEGEKERVDSVLKWCRKGPPLSEVEKVSLSREEFTGNYNSFDITY